MRIAHLTQTYPPMISGAALAACELSERMVAAGHKVLVVTASEREKGYVTDLHNLKIMRLASRPNPARAGQRYMLWPARAVGAALRAFQPDIVHLHEPLSLGLLGLQGARRLGAPVVYTAHQLPWFAAAYAPRILALPRLVEAGLWRYARWFLGQCTAVTAPTATIAQIITEKTAYHAHAIPCGLDLRRFQPRPAYAAEAESLRRKYGLHPTQPVLLHVGRLDKDKSVSEVLLAAAQVLPQANAQLLVVGDGSQRRQLMALSRRLGIARRCHFPGYVLPESPDLPGLYRLATAFVTASTIETFGLVVAEAMACGCPVIAPAATCMPELIRPYRTGLLVPPHNPMALASHLRWMLDHPVQAQAMGREARQEAEKYGMSSMVTRFLALYAAILSLKSVQATMPEAVT